MSRLIELTTGSEDLPTLTYTSASVIVAGLALMGTAAWAFLRFYKLALEVAEKQISLLKTLKEIRSIPSKGSVDNLEEQIKEIVGAAIQSAVDGAVGVCAA